MMDVITWVNVTNIPQSAMVSSPGSPIIENTTSQPVCLPRLNPGP